MKNTKCLVVIFALFGALFTISTSASGQAVQWTQAEGGNGNWYEAVDIDSTYQAARSYCEDLGGHLVSLTSADEDTWVYTNLDGGDARWIGAYQDINSPEYSEPNGGWGWVSGEAWSYTNWNGDGPDNNDLSVPDEEAGHYCCGGAWNDLYEVTNGSPVERKFIMEWSADCNGDGMVDYGQILSGELADDDGNGVPDMCEPQQWRVEDGGNGHWYAAYNNMVVLDWEDASQQSIALGGHLATPSTDVENQWIKNNVAGDASLWSPNHEGTAGIIGPWIGGYRSAGDSWTWIDGSDWSFENWHPGNPDGDPTLDAKLLYWELNDTFAWQDRDASIPSETFSFIIEYSADCNGDGMVDYGQILSGELADDDGNGVPDMCEPQQWRVEDGGNGNWYELVINPQPINWNAAVTAAEQVGGHLVTCTSQEENNFVRSNLIPCGGSQSEAWMGGYRESSGAWAWITGETWDYENWVPGDPNNNSDQPVLNFYYSLSDGCGWADQSDLFNYEVSIIEYSADCNGDGMVDYGQILSGELADDDGNGVPDMCEPQQWRVEDGGNGNWYELVINPQPINWNAAVTAAEQVGGHLVTCTSQEENNFVRSNLIPCGGSQSEAWMGGYRESSGAWAWITGETWDYENWVPGDPNNNSDQPVLNFYYSLSDGCGWADQSDLFNYEVSIIEYSADCNGDGMVDYGQILSGELADDDGNGVPDVCEECPGDIIDDGVVDLVDFTSFLVNFGATGENIADLNGDLVVDLNDFSIFLVNYGNVCETRSAVAETGVGKVAPTHHIGGVPRRSMN